MDFPLLRLNKQFSLEAMDVLGSMKHLWLTSCEAFELSERTTVMDMVKRINIFERDLEASVFVDPDYSITTRQPLLARLVRGSRLQLLLIRLEPFYGAHVPHPDCQGVDLFFAAIGPDTLCSWECTDVGTFLIDSVRSWETVLRHWHEPVQQLRPEQLHKVGFEHRFLGTLWDCVKDLPIQQLQLANNHAVNIYHWRDRWAWRLQRLSFPHRCDRAHMAAWLYV